MSTNILETYNLCAGYGKSIILHDITFSLKKGTITLIIGPNGSGKSTFAKAIFNLATIYSGRITYKGKDITYMPTEDKVYLGISLVPQTSNVFENLTVRENLEITYYTLKKHEKIDFNEKLENIYAIFPDLKTKYHEKVRNLSGGQRQMVAIARALIVQPDILILDEPSSQLSPNLAKLMFDKITDINELGVSIILIEQNVKMALDVANYVYIFQAGKKVIEGPSEIFKTRQDILENAFFGKI